MDRMDLNISPEVALDSERICVCALQGDTTTAVPWIERGWQNESQRKSYMLPFYRLTTLVLSVAANIDSTGNDVPKAPLT
jgi:hypothetical protein